MVTATFETVEYRGNGVISVPVTFGENVIAPSKSIFEITHVSGDALTDIEYRLIGQNTAFELIFEIPPDRKGSFQVAANGDVFKVSSRAWDNVTATPKTIVYSTAVPFIKNFDIPANYTPGEVFDVVLQFNVAATFVDPTERFGNDDATFLDHFIFEGADLGTPNLYRKLDDTYPELPIDDDLTQGWSNLNLTTEAATIYLMRFASVNENATGIFNLTLRENAVRGPISS